MLYITKNFQEPWTHSNQESQDSYQDWEHCMQGRPKRKVSHTPSRTGKGRARLPHLSQAWCHTLLLDTLRRVPMYSADESCQLQTG